MQGSLHIGICAFAEIFLRQADFHAFERFVQIAGVVFLAAFQAGGIALVEARHCIEQNRAVFGGLRHRTGLVETGGVGNHAKAGNRAVGRFNACDTAV